MINKAQNGEPFSANATHATAAVASKAGATNKRHYIASITVSSDKAGSICIVKQGTTTIWEVQVGAGRHHETFPIPLEAAVGALVSVEIDGTSLCKANLAGFTVAGTA